MVNTDKQFLDAIHGKIIRKKRQWATMFTSAMMLMVIFITYESSNIIQIERYESLWSEYQYEQEEYYSWEVNDTISDEELFAATLDLYDMDEILEILDDSTELRQILKTTNMEG
jgi:ATP:corrinoid adenosyltransferase